MRKNFKYRIYPSRKQRNILNAQLEECRWLYNHFLEERKSAYESTGKSPNSYDQCASIPKLALSRPSLRSVNAQVLQNVAGRLDLAFKHFFRRVKNGDKPGYPRFKGTGWYKSITFPQVTFTNGAPNGCSILDDGLLRVDRRIGTVKIKYHRPMEGRAKTCTIKRTRTGKWFAFFACEIDDPYPLPKSKKQIGIDMGLTTFAAMSDGTSIKRRRFFKEEEKALAKAQQKLSKAKKGTTERAGQRRVVARVYERMTNKRENFVHQASRKIVNKYGFIAVEDLEINHMKSKGEKPVRKSINDVAWSSFFALLFYKAESAGRTIVKVNPAYTSQTCSSCDHRQKMPLDKRIFKCKNCKTSFDRDHNAALNVLSLGLQAMGVSLKASKVRPLE